MIGDPLVTKNMPDQLRDPSKTDMAVRRLLGDRDKPEGRLIGDRQA